MEISIQDLIDRVEKGEDVNNVVSEALDSMPPEQSNVSDDNAAKDIKSVVTNPDSTDDKKDKDKTITDKPSLKLVVDNNPYVYDIIDENKELFKDCIITSSSDLKQKTIECPDEDTLSKVTELLKQYIVDDSDNKSTEVSKEPVNSDAIKEVNPTDRKSVV